MVSSNLSPRNKDTFWLLCCSRANGNLFRQSQNGGGSVSPSGTAHFIYTCFGSSMASSAKKRAVGLGENPEDSDNSSDDNLEEDDDSGEEDSEASEEDINEVKTQKNERQREASLASS